MDLIIFIQVGSWENGDEFVDWKKKIWALMPRQFSRRQHSVAQRCHQHSSGPSTRSWYSEGQWQDSPRYHSDWVLPPPNVHKTKEHQTSMSKHPPGASRCLQSTKCSARFHRWRLSGRCLSWSAPLHSGAQPSSLAEDSSKREHQTSPSHSRSPLHIGCSP